MITTSYIMHTGKVNKTQEDSILIDGKVIQDSFDKALCKSFDIPSIFALSDGIAGMIYGEVASRKILEYLYELYTKNSSFSSIVSHIKTTQDKLALLSTTNPKYYGMGATLAGLLIEDRRARVFNVGDSRVYLYRDMKLQRLSVDHTVARNMHKKGELESSEDCANIYKMLDSAIVADEEADDFEIHTLSLELKKGDRLLICTDGVTDMIEEPSIEALFQKEKEVEQIALELLKKAMKNGGEDNLSLIVLENFSI
ncbi:MAG: PP2C family protein-serine/threonine phosphatase [Campylobacterales bacterium]